MSSKSGNQWAQLGAPLELVDKGKYGPEKTFKWKFTEPTKDFNSTNDSDYWKSRSGMVMKDIFSQGVNGSDHECDPDDYFRCKYCGIVLKWACYGKINKINEPYEIFYYDYSYIEVHEKQRRKKKGSNKDTNLIDDMMVNNFTEINHILIQRDMVLYVVSRQTGQGLSDHQIKKQGNQTPVHILPLSLQKLQVEQERIPSIIHKLFLLFYFYKLTGDIPLHKDIELYADFESANMRSAIIDSSASNLRIILKSDSNSLGFQQWFFFGVKYKCENESTMNLVILNQRKKCTLFSSGMKPYVGLVDNSGVITWSKITTEIIYKKAISYSRKKLRNSNDNFSHINLLENHVNHEDININNSENNDNTQDSNDRFSSLQFSHKFTKNSQRVLFSYAKPFTYTDLIDFLESKEKELKSQPSALADFSMKTRTTLITTDSVAYKRELIGSTRLGLAIQMLEITASKEQIKQSEENAPSTAALPYAKRKIILILARQHPFETPSSLVCNGFITFLLSSDLVAVRLRDIFIFKIVPMLNPDGVAVGNSRTNIAGSDLNRCWEQPSQKLEPEIFYLKQYFKQLKDRQKRDIFIAMDIHASATKNGAFLVGCEQNHGLSSNSNWVSNRLLPKVMQESVDYFNYGKCRFNMLPKNACTARVTLWRDFKAKYSFNYECSMYGHRVLTEKEQILRKNNEQINQLDDSQAEGSLSNTSRQSKTSHEEDRNRSKGERQFKEFEEYDYLNMGAEVCSNILHFSVMTAVIQAEIDKNSVSADIDLNRLKIKQGSNDLSNADSVSSSNTNLIQMSLKLQDQQQRSSLSLQLTKNRISSSLQGDFSKKNGKTSLILQSSLLSMGQTSQINEPKQGFMGKQPTFLKKIQKTIAPRQSSLAESSETGSWIGSFQSNSLEDIGQDGNPLKGEEEQQEERKINENSPPKNSICSIGGRKQFGFKLNLLPKKLSIEESPLDGCPAMNDSLNKITTSSRGRINSSSSSSKRNLNSKSSSREKRPPLSSPRQHLSASSSSKILIDNHCYPADNNDGSNTNSQNCNILINETFKNSEGNLDLSSKSIIQNNDGPIPIAVKANNPMLLRLKQPASRISVQYSPQHLLTQKTTFPMKQNSKQRLNSLINPILPSKITERDDSFDTSSRKRNGSIGSNGNSTSRSISRDTSPMRNSIYGNPNPLLNTPKNNNKTNNNSIKHSSFNRNGMVNRRGAVTSSYSSAVKKKKSQFNKYLLSSKEAIKEILPLARSFDWVDYFSFEEVESQIGVAGVQDKLINIFINNMDTITEYDTDSAPEDDLRSESNLGSSKSFDSKQTLEMSHVAHSPRTMKILDQLYARYDSKFKSYLNRLKYDELIGLLDGVMELDENGKIQKVTKNLKKTSNEQNHRQSDATTISSISRGSFWSTLIGKAKKISSVNSSPDNSPKVRDSLMKVEFFSKSIQESNSNSSKDDVHPLGRYDMSNSESESSGTWSSAKANFELNHYNHEEAQTIKSPNFNQINHKYQYNLNAKNIKAANTYAVQSRLLLPKLELIKIRNPFLPSHQEILDKYNYNSITNSTKFSSGKSPLITLTTFSVENQVSNLHLNPVSRMSPTGLMQIPSQTISSFSSSPKQQPSLDQNKQYVQTLQGMVSLKRGRQRSQISLQDNYHKNTTAQHSSFNRSYSSSSSGSKHRLPTREASTDPIKEDFNEQQPNRKLSNIFSSSYAPSRSSSSVDGSKQLSPSLSACTLVKPNEQPQQQFLELEPPAFRITNSQFGSRIIPFSTNSKHDQGCQQRKALLMKQQQSAKVLMVYSQQFPNLKQETQSRQTSCLGSSKTVISFKRKDLFASTVKVSSQMY